jgi:hypothetical protein
VRFERGPILALLILTGCPALKPSEGLQTTPVTQLFDHDAFVCADMPVLIRHCSYSGCHGSENHAFRVYSPGKLRLGDVATRDDRDAMLTNDEIEANYASATGVLLQDHPAPGASVNVKTAPLLLKPLKARFGGSEHHGVGVFPFSPAQTLETDPEWQALVSWVAGEKEPTPPTADCQALMTALQGGS